MPITPRMFRERGRRRAAALGIDPSRLPPGQSPTVKWPLLTIGRTPRIEQDAWLLSVDGAVERPCVLEWQELLGAPQTDWSGDIHCVPHLYLWKSAKWIHRLEILEGDRLGFWEENGYHDRGDPWRKERYSVDEYVARTRRREVRQGSG